MNFVIVVVDDETILADTEKQKALEKGMRALAKTMQYEYKDANGKEHSISLDDFDIIFPDSSHKDAPIFMMFPTLVTIKKPQSADGHISEDDFQKQLKK
jgi:hypothetical protein